MTDMKEDTQRRWSSVVELLPSLYEVPEAHYPVTQRKEEKKNMKKQKDMSKETTA